MQELARGVITIELNLDNLSSFTMIKITQNVSLFQQHLPTSVGFSFALTKSNKTRTSSSFIAPSDRNVEKWAKLRVLGWFTNTVSFVSQVQPPRRYLTPLSDICLHLHFSVGFLCELEARQNSSILHSKIGNLVDKLNKFIILALLLYFQGLWVERVREKEESRSPA